MRRNRESQFAGSVNYVSSADFDWQEREDSRELKSILRQLEKLAESELDSLAEAIELELHRRDQGMGDMLDSARRRANEREQGYRRCNGALAPPVRAVGLGKAFNQRRAA